MPRRIEIGRWELRNGVRIWIDETEQFKRDWKARVPQKIMARKYGMSICTVFRRAQELGLGYRNRGYDSSIQ